LIKKFTIYPFWGFHEESYFSQTKVRVRGPHNHARRDETRLQATGAGTFSGLAKNRILDRYLKKGYIPLAELDLICG